MKVIINELERVELETFADKHSLVMHVGERDMAAQLMGLAKYTAKFKGVEVKKGLALEGAYGNGATPENAIKDYCSAISSQWIVVNAYGDNRRVIYAPHLIPVFTMELQSEVS